MARIKDSGNRTEFSSGAVRDIQTGKGRCDLLPLDVINLFLGCAWELVDEPYDALSFIQRFEKTGDFMELIKAAKRFSEESFKDEYTAILEYSIHMEDGATKYGERNWEKGIPTDRYIDSAIRHYLKYKRGDTDERHDRAVLWNLLCGAWTCINMPEHNSFAPGNCVDILPADDYVLY